MQHFYNQIHGWFNFADLYRRMVEDTKEPALFVEVGAWKGKSAAFMAVEIANSGKNIDFHTLDWGKGSGDPGHVNDPDIVNGTLVQTLERNLEPVSAFVDIKIGDHRELAREYADESIDFVFIDAQHDEPNVQRDCMTWWPKVKPGGIIAGDDWLFEGVMRGVTKALSIRTAVHIECGKGSTHPFWWARK